MTIWQCGIVIIVNGKVFVLSTIQRSNIYGKKVHKEVVSNFSITPKSSGYNYGTDASLERNYELAVAQNLNNFVTFLSSVSLNDCL